MDCCEKNYPKTFSGIKQQQSSLISWFLRVRDSDRTRQIDHLYSPVSGVLAGRLEEDCRQSWGTGVIKRFG